MNWGAWWPAAALALMLAAPAHAAPAWHEIDGGAVAPASDQTSHFAYNPSLTALNGVPHAAWSHYEGANTIRVGRRSGTAFSDTAWPRVPGSPDANPQTGGSGASSLAVVDGRLTIAWEEVDFGNAQQIRAARFDNASQTWSYLPAGSGQGTASPLNISSTSHAYRPRVADVGGSPHVAWYEEGPHPSCNCGTSTPLIRVKRFNGTSWVALGSAHVGIGREPDVVSVNGVPYVTYEDFEDQNSDGVKVTVKRYDSGTNTWIKVGSGANPISTYSNFVFGTEDMLPRIAVVGTTPYVAWTQVNEGQSVRQTRVKRFNGTNWVEPNAAKTSLNHDTADNASAATIRTVNGNVAVGWLEDDGTNREARVSQFNGSGWAELGGGANPINRDASTNAHSLDLGSSDSLPLVVWTEGATGGSDMKVHASVYGDKPLPPQNTQAPVMNGVPRVGNTLTCTPGTWTGATGPVQQRWRRGQNPIDGATGTSYVVKAEDAGFEIACEDVATNSTGDATKVSNSKTAAAGVPVSTGPPVIAGTAIEGQPLTCGNGAWDNQPKSFTRRWLRHGQAINGATGTQYTVARPDVDAPITCEVKATNDIGESASATSPSVLGINDIPRPFSGDGPRLRVVNRDGPVSPTNKRLECSPYRWSQDPDPNARKYRIEREAGGTVATERTYDITVNDLGQTFACVEIVTNAKGSNELKGPPTVVPLPPDVGAGGVKFLKAGGVNRFDPVNLMASTEGLNVAIAPGQIEQVRRSLELFMPTCSGVGSGLPTTHPSKQTDPKLRITDTCRMLVNSPAENIKIQSTGVRVVNDPSKCFLGDNDPCAPLPIPLRGADPTGQTATQDVVPQRVLWDLDGNGSTDLSCPGTAPIARTIYRAAWYKVRAVVVLPDSEETGYFPSVTEWFDHHSPLPPVPEMTPYLPEPFSLATAMFQPHLVNPVFDLSFNFAAFRKLAAAQDPKPPSGIKAGTLRKAQPTWCWDKLDPPVLEEKPCTSKGKIGSVTIEGNICPISLRRIPEAELAAMERTDPELFNLLVAQNDALGAARRAASWRRAKSGVTKAQNDPGCEICAFIETTNDFTAYQPKKVVYTREVRSLAQDMKLPIETLPGILDQTAIIRGNAKINGVTVEGARTLLLPSDVADIAGSPKKLMRIFASNAMPVLGPVTDLTKKVPKGFPLGDPEKGVNAAIDDAIDAGTQALVKEFDLDKLRDSTNSRVRDLLKNLNLGPFNLAGDVDVKFVDGTAFVDAWAELPLLNKVRGRVQMRATEDGQVHFDGISIDLRGKPVKLGVLNLRNVFIEYKPAEGLLLKGELTFPWAGGAGIEIVEFRIDNDNTLRALILNYIAGAGTGISVGPGVFLTKLGGGFRDTKAATEFLANATLSVGTSVGQGCSPLAAKGTLLIHFAPAPFFVRGDLGLEVVCLELASGYFKAEENGNVHVEASMGFDAGPLFFNGKLTGDIRMPNWQGTLDVEGGIRFPSPLPDISGSLHGIISNRGIAVCAEVFGFEGGAGVKWNPLLLAGPIGIIASIRLFEGCGMDDYRTINPSRLVAAQNGGRTFPIAKGERGVVVSVEGLGAAPKVKLTGPDGTTLDVSGDQAGVKTDSALATRVEDEDRTVFLLKAPAAGSWTVEPAADSVQIVRIQQSRVTPEPKVSAKVVRKGSFYELHYSVAKQDGQVVRFVEEAPDGGQDLVTIKGGGKGVKRFIPSDASGASRAIVAQVEQSGMPRENVRVLKFSAPSPRVGKPGKVKVRRRGKGAIVTWSPAFFAKRYEITVSTSTGERTLYVATSKKRQVIVKRLATKDTLTANVVGVSPDGKLGPGGKGKLSAVKKKKKKR
jgi:hypothetical protein